jgi:hypothetical protein
LNHSKRLVTGSFGHSHVQLESRIREVAVTARTIPVNPATWRSVLPVVITSSMSTAPEGMTPRTRKAGSLRSSRARPARACATISGLNAATTPIPVRAARAAASSAPGSIPKRCRLTTVRGTGTSAEAPATNGAMEPASTRAADATPSYFNRCTNCRAGPSCRNAERTSTPGSTHRSEAGRKAAAQRPHNRPPESPRQARQIMNPNVSEGGDRKAPGS